MIAAATVAAALVGSDLSIWLSRALFVPAAVFGLENPAAARLGPTQGIRAAAPTAAATTAARGVKLGTRRQGVPEPATAARFSARTAPELGALRAVWTTRLQASAFEAMAGRGDGDESTGPVPTAVLIVAVEDPVAEVLGLARKAAGLAASEE